MTPSEYCQHKVTASGSSFTGSFRLLEKPKREAMTALYAYCREVDDVVDECSDAGIANIKLAWWRQEINDLYTGKPSHPVTQALAAVLERYPLPQALFIEIIDGMAMDLQQNRYANYAELTSYCYRVASAVGLLAAEIFGYQDKRTLLYAQNLGLALQLTNIIRDVGEDARRGRIYLPQDEMAAYGVTDACILHRRHSDSFRQLIEFQARRAEDTYALALSQLPPVDRKAQRAGLVMAAIYRTLLQEIVKDGCRVLSHRICLPPARKLWLTSKAWLGA